MQSLTRRRIIAAAAVLPFARPLDAIAGASGVGAWNRNFRDAEAGFIHAYDGQPGSGAVMDGYFATMLQYVEGLLLVVPGETDMDALKEAYSILSFMEWQVRGLIDDQKSNPQRLRVLQKLSTQIALAKLAIEQRWIGLDGDLKDLTADIDRTRWRSPLIPEGAPPN